MYARILPPTIVNTARMDISSENALDEDCPFIIFAEGAMVVTIAKKN